MCFFPLSAIKQPQSGLDRGQRSYCVSKLARSPDTFLHQALLFPSLLPNLLSCRTRFTCPALDESHSRLICSYVEQVHTLNVLGIHNISLDITALTYFADESGIATLRECFAKLNQLIDIVLRYANPGLIGRKQYRQRLQMREILTVSLELHVYSPSHHNKKLFAIDARGKVVLAAAVLRLLRRPCPKLPSFFAPKRQN